MKRRGGKYLNLFSLFFLALTVWSFINAGLPSKANDLKSQKSAPGTTVAHSFAPLPGSSGLTIADSARFNYLYDSLDLDSMKLSKEAYRRAVLGYLTLEEEGEIRNPGVLSIVDFSLPSTMKRLFILDMVNGRLLFNSLVAHGRNSGTVMATRFSNRPNSFMSSLGFYLTGDTYRGHNGYSLKLEGIEKGWNDNADRRAIVLHPAWYVSERHIRDCGYLGRSEGCPAIPPNIHRAIIDRIKGGSCLFLYGPDKDYVQRSKVVG